MGVTSVIGKVFKTVTGPLGVLEDWAKEPLKRWENNRQQQNADRAVERRIREQTGVESVKSQLRREEAEHLVSLEIKMQTDIARINAETEQWAKDKEAARSKELAEAAIEFIKQSGKLLSDIQSEFGNMNLELREKAQNFILEKTREFKAEAKEAFIDSMEEVKMIKENFPDDKEMEKMYIEDSRDRYRSFFTTTTEFIVNLKDELKNMNQSIDRLTISGQNNINRIINSFSSTMALPQADSNIKHIQGRISNDDIEDVQAEEVK